MKRIIFTIIFIATQIGCMAQVNPKVEKLYEYLKAKNLISSCEIGKEISGEMYKIFECNFFVCEDDFPGRVICLKRDAQEFDTDSIRRLLRADKRGAFKMIRSTILDLADDAAESYSYEYHQNGMDTIITSMALKNANNNDIVSRMDGNNRKNVVAAHEMINFTYKTDYFDKSKDLKGHLLTLKYRGIIEQNYAPSSFDIKTLQNKIAPLVNDKTIKRHTFTCNVDSTYNLRKDRNFYSMLFWPDIWGKNNTTVLKFTDETRANNFLHQLMECVRKNIESNPHQAYSICPDNSLFWSSVGAFPTPIFIGRQTDKYIDPNSYEKYKVENIKKRLIIQTHSDMEGFYILISEIEGCVYHPAEWKSLKEFNNGKKTYYKNKL